MNLGKAIFELRKKQNITQEELAAQLGVTAAAVSKWENNYTLPDILMLCALADHFGVTTDELLGRSSQKQYTVIVAEDASLGRKIEKLAAGFGIAARGIYPRYDEAIEAIRADERITHLLCGHLDSHMPVIDFNMFSSSKSDDDSRKISFYVSVSEHEADILEELESCLK